MSVEQQFSQFMRDIHTVDFVNVALGGLGALITDITIDVPLDAIGFRPTWDLKDAEGNWIIGFGPGEIVNAGIGAGMVIGGDQLKKAALVEAGLGWLLGLSIAKLSELHRYIWLKWQETKTSEKNVSGSPGQPSGTRKTPGIVIKL